MICNHQRRRLEIEKEELQSALEEAEAALEQEENKVSSVHLATSVWKACIWLGNGNMCGQKMNKEFQKQLLVQVMRAQLDLAQVRRLEHQHRPGSKITFWDFAVLHVRDL